MGLVELQKATVLAQFGDERQVTEQQLVCVPLILLLLDLKDRRDYKNSLSANVLPRGAVSNGTFYIVVVVRVEPSLQQRQQVAQATGEVLLLHLREEAANLSAETPQVGLRGQRPESGLSRNHSPRKVKCDCTFSAFSHVLTSENRLFWLFKSRCASRALMAMAAIFLQRGESSLTTTRASGAKNKVLC